jgi:hypothetical protein
MSDSTDQRRVKKAPVRGEKRPGTPADHKVPGRWSAHVRMDPAVWDRYAEVCAAQGIDRSEGVRRFIAQQVAAYDKRMRNQGALFTSGGGKAF